MTCAECREAFSAHVDGALGADARGAVEQHLAGCGECQREWRRFFATVDLLHLVQSERAPAGFVDRVLAAARPEPWYRRLARGLLVPWPVKLPLEAAAVVMVAGLAVLVFQRSSELQLATHAPGVTNATSADDTRAASSVLLSKDGMANAAKPAAPPRVNAPASVDQYPVASTPADPRGARPESKTSESGRSEAAPPRLAQQQADEPVMARRQQRPQPMQDQSLSVHSGAAATAAPPAAVPKTGAVATPAPAEPFGEARATRSDTLAKEAGRDTAVGRAGPQGMVPPARERNAEETEVQKLAARVPPNVELSLAVGDRAGAQAAVTTIVERLGGALMPGAAPAALEIMVPRDAFATLTGDLAQLGTLRVLRQPTELPDSVRIGLKLTD